MFCPVRQVAAPEAKSAVPHCILLILRAHKTASADDVLLLGCLQRVCQIIFEFVPLYELKNDL